MLIKKIDEIQEVLPNLVTNLTATSRLPNFDAVEQKHLVGIIGNALYNSLQTKYNNNTLSAAEKTILKHIRLVIASYGFLGGLIATHVKITDFGVRTNGTEEMPKAVGWEYKELKAFLLDNALEGTEVLLNHLWANKATLPLWTESDQYKTFEHLLIRTGTEFSSLYTLYHPMRTFYSFRSLLDDAQDSLIIKGIGADLVEYFLTKQDPSAAEKECLKLLKKALAFLTIKKAGDHFSVRFSDSGFSIISEFGGDRDGEDSGRAAAGAAAIARQLKACEFESKQFMTSAKQELVKLRKDPAAAAEFITAFDKGPLVKYIDPSQRTTGNDRRKIFVM